MKIDKATSVYEHLERVCQAIKGKRNLAQQDTATIAMCAIIDDIAALPEGKDMDWLISDAGKQYRIDMRNRIKFLFTASKNVQNVVCTDMGLMDKSDETKSVEEFI